MNTPTTAISPPESATKRQARRDSSTMIRVQHGGLLSAARAPFILAEETFAGHEAASLRYLGAVRTACHRDQAGRMAQTPTPSSQVGAVSAPRRGRAALLHLTDGDDVLYCHP
jgi:hypothetical protein